MNDDDKLLLHDFRSELPLTDSDFTAIRAEVMSRIAAPRRSLFTAFRVGLAFAAIVAIMGGVAVVSLLREVPAAPTAPVVRQTRPTPQVAALPEPEQRVRPVTKPSKAVAASAPTPHRHHHRRRVARPLLAAAAPPRVIQLQTSDADIRIIWITR